VKARMISSRYLVLPAIRDNRPWGYDPDHSSGRWQRLSLDDQRSGLRFTCPV
jgi:hypothetical protein